ncbi:MAG: hypothetical protein JXA81_07415 [Sedimentisphaerales bacterium]|nr:hypothetical protein [Sedimentisphaerales bacterium]
MVCIYCLENKSESFFQHTEHVIPKAFGTFEQNLTLNRTVCDDCNQYFGDNIELYLGRDSLEGISRYHYGIRSSKEPLYKRVKMKLGIQGELEGVHVILKDTDASSDPEVEAINQVGFFHPDKQKYTYFAEDEIPDRQNLENQGYQLNNQKIVFYGDLELLVEILKEKGINIKIEKVFKEIQNKPKALVPVFVHARIDRTIYRGIAKILFNYFAYNVDRYFVLKDCFNGLRKFIRYDQGEGDRYFNIKVGAFYGIDFILQKRKIPGHVVLINWENNNSDLVGKLALYNAQIGLTYLISLCRNFRGIWIPIQHGHKFNPDNRKIQTVPYSDVIV